MYRASHMTDLVSLALGSTLVFGFVSCRGAGEAVVLLELIDGHGLGNGRGVMLGSLMVGLLDGNGGVGDARLDSL